MAWSYCYCCCYLYRGTWYCMGENRMKARELARQLLLTPDLEVLKSSDDEGNSYSAVDSVDVCRMNDDTDYEIEVGLAELTDDLRRQGFTQEDVCDGPKVVVLW